MLWAGAWCVDQFSGPRCKAVIADALCAPPPSGWRIDLPKYTAEKADSDAV